MKSNPIIAYDLKALASIVKPRKRTNVLAYGIISAFVICTVFLAFNPSSNTSSPWFSNLFTSSSSLSNSIAPYKSQVSSLVSRFFPNSTGTPFPGGDPGTGGGVSSKDGVLGNGSGREVNGSGEDGFSKGRILNQTGIVAPVQKGSGVPTNGGNGDKNVVLGKNQTGSDNKNAALDNNKAEVEGGVLEGKKKQTGTRVPIKESEDKTDKNVILANNPNEVGAGVKKDGVLDGKKSQTENEHLQNADLKTSVAIRNGSVPVQPVSSNNGSGQKSGNSGSGKDRKREKWIEDMVGCDLFQGQWVKDDSYPLYPQGHCPHIDEPFNCYLNGRPDHDYQKLRWKPMGCNIPRLNGTNMLERLRGKRLVFVGDSLNRNMWESLVCVLRNSIKDKKNVFEGSGRHEFRTEGSYSFLFKDYNATVEFFRSPFLVQEWEMHDGNTTKETLRLDIIERSSSKYKDGHVIIFNTGHWWTHEKTSKGKDYYQEGNRVYTELNVDEAFHKALNTWARWVDANVDPKKSLVFFRGYSASHFSGGQWNSGGACDRETEPIKNEKYLTSYPPKMSVLESVIEGMKTPVSYLNITRMTDYRKDAHPSVFRKKNLTEEERKDPERFQDCSHWCLPGVPDSWNEILYAQLIIKQYQMSQ